MGFLSGSMTFERFQIVEDPTAEFGESHLEKLKKFQVGTAKANLYEQPNVGFVAGQHLLDVEFDYAKNVIGEALHFGIRVDSCQIPSPIKKAWMQIELAPMLVDNPSGKPSKAQRQEAKEAVEARCADEADKGNFRRMAETSVLWDAETDTIFLGTTSEKSSDVCLDLLERAFGIELARVTSGRLALNYANESDQYAELCDVQPTAFHAHTAPHVVWWNGMSENFDYLGNEFLLWLWWRWEMNSDMIDLPDGTAVSGMFARSLTLDCPQGEFGKESISSDSPVALPETAMAVRMGKLPRKAGLTLVREGEQYDLTLQAERFSVGGARITQVAKDAGDLRDREDRINSVRELCVTVDLLFEAFCQQRIGKSWKSESAEISKWLQKDTLKHRKAA